MLEQDNRETEVVEANEGEEVATLVPETKTGESGESEAKFSFDEKSLTAAASYVGPLIVIPFITGKDDPFTKFHLKQGILVFVPLLLAWVLGEFFFFLWPIIQLINFGILVFAIIGVVNALQGKEVPLPLIGHFADRVKI